MNQHKPAPVSALQIFGDLTWAAFEQISAAWTVAYMAAEDTLFEPHTPGEVLFLIKRGRVQLERQRDGVRQIEIVLGPGAIFGHMPLIGQVLRNRWATAVEDAEVYVLSRAEVVTLVRRRPLVALQVLSQIGPQLLEAEAKVKGLAGE